MTKGPPSPEVGSRGWVDDFPWGPNLIRSDDPLLIRMLSTANPVTSAVGDVSTTASSLARQQRGL